MKIYEIFLCDNNYNCFKTLELNSPISKKDLDKYFLEYENLNNIACFNKKGLNIYDLYKDKKFNLFVYNKENKKVYIQWSSGKIEYPEGKEKYDEYITEKRKERLNKIINKKE